MSQLEKLYIVATGMLTSVGYNTAMTAASVNAGISGVQESKHMNKRGKAMKMACIPNDALPPLNEQLLACSDITAIDQQLLRMCESPLQETLGTLKVTQEIPLFLASTEPVNSGKPVCDKFIQYLCIQAGVKLDIPSSQVLPTGKAAGIEAINLAFEYIAMTNADFVVVGGVDSYQYNLMQLGLLDQQDRILAEQIMDGFAPGEAAGFILLASEEAKQKYKLQSKLTLYEPGLAEEEGHRYSEEPYKGNGLAAAFTQAIANGPQLPIHSIHASLSGENFGVKEYGVAMMRNSKVINGDAALEHPADCLGDVNAAFAPILLALMAHNNSGSALAYCASEGPNRAAICVSSQ